MPLSELWRLVAEKTESGQRRPCSTDVSSPGENDLVELVWENGQIAMQSQSIRSSGSLALNGMSSNTNRMRDAMSGHPISTTARIGKFGGVGSIMDDMSSVVPSGELDFGQDDEMVPWLNYPIGDALPQDYVSDLLPEISGVTTNGMSVQNSVVSVDKRSGFDGTVNNLHSSGNASSSKAHSVCSWQVSDGLGSGVSNVTSIKNTNSHLVAVFGNPAQGNDTVKETVTERPTLGLPTNNPNVLNFPYFSRPANIVKANNPNFLACSSSGVGRTEGSEKDWTTGGRNPFKSIPFDRSNSVQKNIDFCASASSSKIALADSRRPAFEAPKELLAPESTEKLSEEPPMKNEKPTISSSIANPIKGVLEGDRNVESMVISSSVGSGNSADRVSCEQTHNSKRKFRDVEETDDDIETISIGVKKLNPARGGNGSKRSRAAEVHNLSERRRRDRINEKMRALQELIPNCNKVDKASMLDEAIEYLKTLQLQVQIMSMGAGLYMPPPLMFPTGMQHMHSTHVSHFAPMGVGMGMGMGLGFGMGMPMPDATSGSPSRPVFPVSPVRFPSPGPTNFQRIPAPNLPVYGHPSQGLHSSAPGATLVPVSGHPIVSSTTGLSGLGSGNHNDAPSSCPKLNSVDPAPNQNSQSMFKAEASSSSNNKSHKLEATKEVLNQSAVVQEDKPDAVVLAQSSLTSPMETDNKERQAVINKMK